MLICTTKRYQQPVAIDRLMVRLCLLHLFMNHHRVQPGLFGGFPII